MREPASNAFAALYARAGLPASMLAAFRAALLALARKGRGAPDEAAEEGALRLPLIHAALAACEAARDEGLDRLTALLRRFESDAAREASRRSLARLREGGAGSFAPSESSQRLADQSETMPRLEAQAAPEMAPQVERMTEPLAETDIVVDLMALEKELMAA